MKPKKRIKPIDPLHPEPGVLIALGSIAVHVEEMISENGHGLDIIAAQSALATPGVRAWIAQMDAMALLPVKR